MGLQNIPLYFLCPTTLTNTIYLQLRLVHIPRPSRHGREVGLGHAHVRAVRAGRSAVVVARLAFIDVC